MADLAGKDIMEPVLLPRGVEGYGGHFGERKVGGGGFELCWNRERERHLSEG